MKFNDEELSRILSAHVNGEMCRAGWNDLANGSVCVVQAAEQVTADNSIWYLVDKHPCYSAMKWFDNNYDPSWSPAKFLSELEKQGLA